MTAIEVRPISSGKGKPVFWVAGAVGSLVLFSWYALAPLAVVYGPLPIKEFFLSEWLNQRSPLSCFQKQALFSALRRDVNNRNTLTAALPVVNAHLHDDEPAIVRELVWIAFSTNDPHVCALALAGLRRASPKYHDIAAATFLFHLENSDANEKDNWLKIAFCIGGLEKLSYAKALPEIQSLTTHSSRYVSLAASQAVARISEQVVESAQPK